METMIKRFGLGADLSLAAIAEIVHDIDLKDNKFNRLEAPGLGAVIRGLADLLKDDRKLVEHCGPIFDGLYRLLERDGVVTDGRATDKRATKEKHREKRAGGRGGKQRSRAEKKRT